MTLFFTLFFFLWLTTGAHIVKWAARQPRFNDISEADKMIILLVWPLWILANVAWSEGWKKR